jgi:hypothetical protein
MKKFNSVNIEDTQIKVIYHLEPEESNDIFPNQGIKRLITKAIQTQYLKCNHDNDIYIEQLLFSSNYMIHTATVCAAE